MQPRFHEVHEWPDGVEIEYGNHHIIDALMGFNQTYVHDVCARCGFIAQIKGE